MASNFNQNKKPLELSPVMKDLPKLTLTEFFNHLKDVANEHCKGTSKELDLLFARKPMVVELRNSLTNFLFSLGKKPMTYSEKEFFENQADTVTEREYEFYDALKEFIDKYSLAPLLKFKPLFSLVERQQT